ncbi:efflux RND transporter periplasmic adaptor subunit [Candidatus Pseudomonas adelgestsugas]|uniref:Efflux pump periplasmic linker TtgA n=1 Tax=Candidatus Pseudomonas adelgestsugas TaxID=1302376 RepID=A0ABX5R951_9PSED|nr:efflux RND transporter periplasmic adaptor subunit [Candidatus Pseudomonas adelgestsugas]QAX82054.1 putative efflux pump periplasmic linker TtgA precursor [Candidatus Pseudomonas adelgestsugas]
MQLKLAIITLVTTIAFTSLLSGCKKEEEVLPTQTSEVGVVTIQPQTFILTSNLPGRTTAYRIAEVRPQVTGIILKRFFQEGSNVKEGQQLYQITSSIYDASLRVAQANLAQTRAIANRYKQLVNEQAVSRQEYDTAVSNQMISEANVQVALINVRYTKVLAPISGRIGRSSVTEGALVSNGQANAMAIIQQLDPIYVDVMQSSAEILKLRHHLESGQLKQASENNTKVKLTLEDGIAYGLDGQLEFSEVSVDQTTGSVTLRATFPNPDHTLLPGMFVHAQLQTGINNQAILVPQQGVTRNFKGTPTALIVNKDNKVEQRQLIANSTDGAYWLVEKGLDAGDRVITEGLQFIKPGIEVKVKNADNTKPASKGE